jgi:lipopolysaccharide export system ATP-binding protein
VSEPLLRASRLRVERGSRVLLRDVDLEAEAGQVVGILGPSGAGKSTFFRALTGEAPPDGGEVVVDGQDVTRWPLWQRARAGVGYIPQSASVFWDMTVGENVEAFRRIATGSEDATAARATAERAGLGHRFDVRAGELSAGERRRLELARAITRKPRILVCDEPFAGVDPAGSTQLGDLLGALARDGVLVLLADHHVAEALRVCTRAVLLLDGAVAADEPPNRFRHHPLVRGRYLGTLTPPTPPPASIEPSTDGVTGAGEE